MLLLPFDPPTWTFACLTCLCVGVVLLLCDRLYFGRGGADADGRAADRAVFQSTIIALVVFAQESLPPVWYSRNRQGLGSNGGLMGGAA